MKKTINLNIERIVLHGLQQIDRNILTEALQQALSKQLSLNPTLPPADWSRVRTNITLPANVGAEQLGQALGQSLNNIIAQNEGTIQSGQKIKLGGTHDA